METKHTPGPWFVDGVNYSDAISIGAIDPQDGCRFLLAEVHGIDEVSVHCSKSEANALLIASAPDLLETLVMARAYIASRCGTPDPEDSGADQILIEIHKKMDAAIAQATGEA